MFKSIIWATDGSAAADRAMPYVKSLASDGGTEVLVLHVDELLMGRGGGQHIIADEEDVRAKLDRQTKELTDSGVKAGVRVVTEDKPGPAHTIAETAKDLGADLIVVGTRGHTVLSGLMLGGVTQRLLHIAPCPVFAVPSTVAGEGSTEGAGTAATTA